MQNRRDGELKYVRLIFELDFQLLKNVVSMLFTKVSQVAPSYESVKLLTLIEGFFSREIFFILCSVGMFIGSS